MVGMLYSFIRTLHYFIIIIMQPYLKALHIDNACQVYCVSKFSQSSFMQYMGMCFKLTHFVCDGFEIMCTLLCCHHHRHHQHHHQQHHHHHHHHHHHIGSINQ